MPLETPNTPVSKKEKWTGYVMSAIPILALVMSAVMKFLKPAPVVQGFSHLGYLESAAFNLGVLELGCTILYIVPQTSVLGAILLTGYLGGATASTFRVGDSWLATVIVGILGWGGLFMRDRRLRALIPLRKNPR
jgi:hypothetical protein